MQISQKVSKLSRILVIGRTLPIQATGTSMMTRRLLENFLGDEIVFLGRTPDVHRIIKNCHLHYPTVQVPSPPQGGKGERFLAIGAVFPELILGLYSIYKYDAKAIWAIYPDEGALLAGYILHRFTNLPLVAYFCDLYQEAIWSGWRLQLAHWLQPRILKTAARIFVLTRGIQNLFLEKHGVRADLIPHTINQAIPEFSPLPPPGDPFVIGYSGNVNQARIDVLRELVACIDSRPGYELRYFSANTEAFLKEQGVWAKNTSLQFIKNENELIGQLSSCDVLYLPVSFNTQSDGSTYEQLQTSFGTKSLEYFLSNRPILLHCPSTYHISQFFKENNCALVLNDPGQLSLGKALEKLRTNIELRETLAYNGIVIARQFEGKRVGEQLRTAFGELFGTN